MASVLCDRKPDLGDLIEIDRGLYQHWAVYVGDGFVVHLAPPCEAPGGQSASLMSVWIDRAFVKKEELLKVVGTDKWKINNSLDKKYKPRSCHVIVKEACALVGQERPYSVTGENCEHFVTNLRYGKPESQQVQSAGEIALYAGLATIATFGFVALAGALLGDSKKETKNTKRF